MVAEFRTACRILVCWPYRLTRGDVDTCKDSLSNIQKRSKIIEKCSKSRLRDEEGHIIVKELEQEQESDTKAKECDQKEGKVGNFERLDLQRHHELELDEQAGFGSRAERKNGVRVGNIEILRALRGLS